MDLETFIVAVFCLVDDCVRDFCRTHRLRRRGPTPVLADSEVLAIETAGEFLGLDTDRGLHAAAISATCSPGCGPCTAPPSCARRRTCGW